MEIDVRQSEPGLSSLEQILRVWALCVCVCVCVCEREREARVKSLDTGFES